MTSTISISFTCLRFACLLSAFCNSSAISRKANTAGPLDLGHCQHPVRRAARRRHRTQVPESRIHITEYRTRDTGHGTAGAESIHILCLCVRGRSRSLLIRSHRALYSTLHNHGSFPSHVNPAFFHSSSRSLLLAAGFFCSYMS